MPHAKSPHRAASPRPDAPLPSAPNHPVGLLYTMLRHGKGMSHEEAHRRSFESIHGPDTPGRPCKAA